MDSDDDCSTGKCASDSLSCSSLQKEERPCCSDVVIGSGVSGGGDEFGCVWGGGRCC